MDMILCLISLSMGFWMVHVELKNTAMWIINFAEIFASESVIALILSFNSNYGVLAKEMDKI